MPFKSDKQRQTVMAMLLQTKFGQQAMKQKKLTLFHGTTDERAPKIAKHGLRSFKKRDYVSVTPMPHDAFDFVNTFRDDELFGEGDAQVFAVKVKPSTLRRSSATHFPDYYKEERQAKVPSFRGDLYVKPPRWEFSAGYKVPKKDVYLIPQKLLAKMLKVKYKFRDY